MNTTSTRIKQIYCGKVEMINDGKRETYPSAYRKKQIDLHKTLLLTKTGFIDDTQADRENHGGEDKAVCVYSQKDYDFFKTKHHLELPTCAFGENLTILDMDDSDVCIGDRFQCGEVVFEVSQPRQPCWKISSILGIKRLTALVVKEHKTGFYLRVIQAGSISSDDTLELISRDYPKFTIEFVNQCAFNAKENQKNIKEILACDKLAKDYHESLSKRYKLKLIFYYTAQREETLFDEHSRFIPPS